MTQFKRLMYLQGEGRHFTLAVYFTTRVEGDECLNGDKYDSSRQRAA